MTSVHQLTETIARVRGVPLATIESYSRVLRRGGVLPETRRGGAATPATPIDAVHILLAVMRGSPATAVESAQEAGGLVLNCDPILSEMERETRAFLGWTEGMRLSEALAWLIEKYRDGTASRYVAGGNDKDKIIKITLDKYWYHCAIELRPSNDLWDIYADDRERFFASIGQEITDRHRYSFEQERRAGWMAFDFKSPFLFEASQAYGVDPARNAAAHRRFREARARLNQFDLYGNETVTNRTLAALGDAFRKDQEARDD